MRLLPCGGPVLGAVALLVSAVAAQGPTGKVGPAKQPVAKEQPPGPVKTEQQPVADKLLLPAGAVLVPYELIKGTARLLPMILVRPEKYREMEERIKELERRLKPARVPLNSFKLTGRLEGDFVVLQAQIRVKTEQPRSLVIVGCKGALLTGDPELDGQLPVITYREEDGYAIQVEKEGQHHLVLPMRIPVTARRPEALAGWAGRGFELGLPGAAVSSLTLELPPSIKELRWNGYVEKAPARPGTWELALGTATSLKMSWREPVVMPGTSPRSASWQTSVVLQENQALTTARLTLEDPAAGTGSWHIGVPAGAELKVIAPEGVPYQIIQADSTTFLLKGPPAEHLEVLITARQPRPFTRLAVGPFLLLGIERQEGVIEIGANPEALWGYRLSFRAEGNVRQQDLPREQASTLIARFHYWQGPEGGRAGGPRQAPLIVEMRPAAAQVEASVEHLLRVRQVEESWQVLVETRIHATPLHHGADYLDVQLPRPYPPALPALAVLAGPAPAGLPQALLDTSFHLCLAQLWPVQVLQEFRCEGEGAVSAELQTLAGRGHARIRLARPQLQDFTVILKGSYLVAPELRQTRLELPRPVAALDRGGVLKVETDDTQELLAPGEAGESAGPDPHHVATPFERTPAFADLAWREYRPQIRVAVLADVSISRRHAHVREELRLPTGPKEGARGQGGTARPLRVSLPDGISSLKVVQGGTLLPNDPGSRQVRVERLGGVLVFEFDFLTPARSKKGARESAQPGGRPIHVPLLWPMDATQGETKVRLWCEPGTVPSLPDLDPAAERWKDRGTEVVPGRDELPALVLESEGRDVPLTLRLAESSLPPLAPVLADRVLVQVQVDEEGTQHYRTRFLLSRVDAGFLDVELPVPPARLPAALLILLDNRRAAPQPLNPGGKVVRVGVPKAALPLLLEVVYDLPANYPEQDGVFRTALHPPVLHGDAFIARARWQVTLPAGQVALPPGGQGLFGGQWAWRGWLLAPAPTATTSELEHWLKGTESGAETTRASLVFGSDGLGPVAVVHFPQQLWLVLCSGILLVLGFVLIAAPLSRLPFWLTVGAVAVAVVAAGLTWPAVFPVVVYGCEPGLLVLALLLTVQWLLQQRYRRQVVFMPGFTRGRASSSLSRGSSANQRPRETSTVDAPQASPSSFNGAAAPAKESVP